MSAAYARAGSLDKAFEWLDKAYDERDGQDITLLKIRFFFQEPAPAMQRYTAVSAEVGVARSRSSQPQKPPASFTQPLCLHSELLGEGGVQVVNTVFFSKARSRISDCCFAVGQSWFSTASVRPGSSRCA